MTGSLSQNIFSNLDFLGCPQGTMEVAFLYFGILSHPLGDFEVPVLCRELMYMNAFVGLGFVSETPEQTDEQD